MSISHLNECQLGNLTRGEEGGCCRSFLNRCRKNLFMKTKNFILSLKMTEMQRGGGILLKQNKESCGQKLILLRLGSIPGAKCRILAMHSFPSWAFL